MAQYQNQIALMTSQITNSHVTPTHLIPAKTWFLFNEKGVKISPVQYIHPHTYTLAKRILHTEIAPNPVTLLLIPVSDCIVNVNNWGEFPNLRQDMIHTDPDIHQRTADCKKSPSVAQDLSRDYTVHQTHHKSLNASPRNRRREQDCEGENEENWIRSSARVSRSLTVSRGPECMLY